MLGEGLTKEDEDIMKMAQVDPADPICFKDALK